MLRMSSCFKKQVILLSKVFPPSVGPYLLKRNLKYGSLFCRWFMVL